MENLHTAVTGKRCKLLRPVRDRQGRNHFGEEPMILREIDNFDRHMYLVKFDDGATTFLFRHEMDL